MALVNPNIAMSYRGIELPQQNALADYAAIQQIQGGRQAQELNALKMQEAQAALQERNALRQLDPAAADYENQLFRVNPTLGIAYRKEAASTAAQQAATTASQAAAAKSGFDLKAAQRTFVDKLKLELSDNPSDENVVAFGQDALIQGLYSPAQVETTVAQLLAMPPPQRAALLAKSGLSANERKPPAPAAPPTSVAEFERAKTDPAFMKFLQNRAAATRPPRPEAAPRTQQVMLSDGSLGIVNMDTGVITPATFGGETVKGKDSSKTAVSEQQAAYNIGRVLTAANQIKDISSKDPSSAQPGAAEALAASVGMTGTANLARNANRQIVQGAQRDALDALLYLATGAAYNKEQLQGQMDAYIPAFTDTAEAVAAKKTRMTALIKSAKTRAGKAWTPEMDTAMDALTSSPAPAAAGVDTSNPLLQVSP